jgi:hypothetical protein
MEELQEGLILQDIRRRYRRAITVGMYHGINVEALLP